MKKIAMILLASVLLLCGCTKSNIVKTEGYREPDTELRQGIEINWGQVWDDLDSQFLDTALYPFSVSVNGNIHDDKNQIDLVLLVQPGTTKEQAASYATDVIKGFNDSVATQDFNYKVSSEDSYGSFISRYDVTVLVSPYDTKEDSSTWILQDTIKAGSVYRPVGAAKN